MKKTSYILLLLSVFLLVLSTCRKKPELKVYTLELSEETVTVSPNSVTITTEYSYPGEVLSVKLLLSTFSDMSSSTEYETNVTNTTISVTLENLNDNTTYYYRYRYANGIAWVDTDVKSFTTEGYTLPTVTTNEVSDITSNTAHCSGEATDAGNGNITAKGFCYGTNQNPTIYHNVINCGDSLGVFEAIIENLDINTTYYVRAFATNEKGTGYGEHKSFITLGQVPTVVTIPITSITASTAVSGGTITDNGGNEVTEKGVCWSTEHYPTTDGNHTSDGTGNGAYVSNLTDLLPNTQYYIRAYATNSQGTGYGNELAFTTSASLPVLTTKSVTDITENSAKSGGNITNNGGMDITARGICWSTEHDPTTNDSHTTDGEGIGEFDSDITDLSANVKYYVRAYATNDFGTAYGEEREFTTQMGLPTVSTKSVTAITGSSASCGGNVTNSGGGTISVRGVCWSTDQNPTISDSHTSDGTGTGEFNSSLTGLNNNTTYYVRAYATNSNGTAYGEERSFTTQEGLAVVVTADVTNVTATTASSGGEVTDDGGFSITARGVCWSTSQNPTTSDAHTSDGTGTGSYTSSLSSLSYNTTYYVRAYATNSNGTSYGEEKTFTTSKLAPTVTTSDVTSITSNSAVCGGEVTDDGGASVTARGVCYSTSQNPTISGQHTSDGNGTGAFTSSLTGLEENTTYYVRAYATNSEGTSYGTQKTFTTSQNVVVPTLTTSEVTNVSTNSATGGGNITSAGYGTVSARGVCWSTSQNPTVSNPHTTDGTGTGSFTSSISGLTENTTYYVRAYATNEAGTAYGEQKTFTTPHAATLPAVTTNNVTDITASTAVSGGNVTSSGYGTVSARGVCYSTSQNPTITDAHTNDGTGEGSYTSTLSGLENNTTYYVRAYATNEAGTAYGEQKAFTTESDTPSWPNGVLPGLFSISSTQQVHFSQGNLQYQASTNTWRFADNQWDYIGSDNANISPTNSGWIDLFGWATSNYNHGAISYHPWSTSMSGEDYYAYGDYGASINSHTCKADWGYNAISNGGNIENLWRTLTRDEWEYIMFTRSTSSGKRYAKAKINGVNGVILLPDNWNINYYSLNNTNTAGASFSSNVISESVWRNFLEAYGAVFLPAAGTRNGSSCLAVNEDGNYYSSSKFSVYQARQLCFYDGGLLVDYNDCHLGRSVRLVYSSYTVPELTTNQATDITTTTAMCGGNITSDGGVYISERGMCWSTSQNPTTNDAHISDGSGTGLFTISITGLNPNTTYYVRAYATNSLGTAYGTQISFTTEQEQPQVPTGALDALFTINENGDQVYFSKGNLQYQASTNIWQFAEHQWDYIGSDNANISSTNSGWIDLFGWGTSGYNHGAISYQPWSTSNTNSDYYAYDVTTYNLNDQTGQADWGYNPISNGGNQTNQWRTLTKYEWVYVFNTRSTTSGIRFAKAQVNGVNGVLLLPDDWNSLYYSLSNTNDNNVSYNSNIISLNDWNTYFEDKGAVFLSAAGRRDASGVYTVGYRGYYWSATYKDSTRAYDMYFNDSDLNPSDFYDRFRGFSVRLVQDAE